MNTIRLLLEFETYPLWLLDEDGFTIDTTLPEEWETDIELDEVLTALMDAYSNLFINTQIEFRYIGFKSTEEKTAFIQLAEKAEKMVERKNNGKYKIINDLHLEEL